MKKQFLFNILLLVVFNALVKPFWVFGIDRSVQNLVGSEAYGLYFALFNFTLLFNILLDLGLTNFNNRSIAQDHHLLKSYFPKIFYSKLVLGILYLGICLCSGIVLGYSSVAVKLMAILGLNQVLASMFLFLRSNISGLQLYTTDSFLSVLERLLMIVFCSILLWTNILPFDIDIILFALLQTVAYFGACITALVILLRKSRGINFRGVSLFSTELVRKSVPFALLAFLMILYNRSDAVLLERLSPEGAKAAGIYAQSYRIFDAVNMIAVLFASLLLPMFSKLLAEKKSILPLIKLSFSILLSGTLILAINLSVFAGPLLHLMYSEQFPESEVVFRFLMVSIIPVSLTYIFGTLLTADGQLSVLNKIAAAVLVINVLLNLIFIPHFHVFAASAVALVTQGLVALAQILICVKLYRLPFQVGRAGKYLLLTALSGVICVLISSFQLPVLMKLFISSTLSLIISFALKIIDLKEILLIFRPEEQ